MLKHHCDTKRSVEDYDESCHDSVWIMRTPDDTQKCAMPRMF